MGKHKRGNLNKALCGLNPFQIRAMGKHTMDLTLEKSRRLNPFQIRAMGKQYKQAKAYERHKSQSLSNQGDEHIISWAEGEAEIILNAVSIPFKSGRWANLLSEVLNGVVKSQSLSNQGDGQTRTL